MTKIARILIMVYWEPDSRTPFLEEKYQIFQAVRERSNSYNKPLRVVFLNALSGAQISFFFESLLRMIGEKQACRFLTEIKCHITLIEVLRNSFLLLLEIIGLF